MISRVSSESSRTALKNVCVSLRGGKLLARGGSLSAFSSLATDPLGLADTFPRRHIGPNDSERDYMLKSVGFETLGELTTSVVPPNILSSREMPLEPARTETEALRHLKQMVDQNVLMKSYIGQGYYDTQVPAVILRNMLENPGWYTAYTPYQAEISQGRLEMLLNFQTMICDLTGLEMACASLLDEATAAAEAMQMCFSLKGRKGKSNKFFVSDDCHPQTISLLETRAESIGIEIVRGNHGDCDLSKNDYCGAIVQYPNTYGSIESPGESYESFASRLHDSNAMLIVATDLMALAKLKCPKGFGADIAVGSAQRLGVPMGFGGPHAGFLSTSEAYARKMPGRIIGVTIDTAGQPALRMAMQTREQHIRRDKATSNICTAQALLANMAAAYCIFHGPEGLRNISGRIHALARVAHRELTKAGYQCTDVPFYDTIQVKVEDSDATRIACEEMGANVRIIDDTTVGISMGESITKMDLEKLLNGFGVEKPSLVVSEDMMGLEGGYARETEILTHPIFNMHHSETQMMRYLKKLENKDLALNHSMISLGSCTMKLNAVSEMIPVSWPKIANIHPFAPAEQTIGYHQMIRDINKDLSIITGFAAVSAQPNSGANGEFAGLKTIKNYLEANGQGHRNVCLIPKSAHGTNPASATMAGMKVVVVDNDDDGNTDFADLTAKISKHRNNLACFMITYPSTFGVFEEKIVEIIDSVHDAGGQVYMDGANMNAQVGLTSPGAIGADVCHLNLHKTFCIPHGGGGPGVGSIGVAAHLAPFLPGHAVKPEASGPLCGGDMCVEKTTGAIAAAPFGSAAILPISWMYIKMCGPDGLKEATGIAILNANYMATRLSGAYDILYKGVNGQVAHEFILDLRPLKASTGVSEEDVAKRLQDYGFHSPTMSWPVTGTLMVEPTESEDLAELDRFCDAMLAIRAEIDEVASGKIALEDSPLRLAPHTLDVVTAMDWDRKYTRGTGAYPAPWSKENKFWPTINRVDNVYGDRNLVCTCPPIELYMDDDDVGVGSVTEKVA